VKNSQINPSIYKHKFCSKNPNISRDIEAIQNKKGVVKTTVNIVICWHKTVQENKNNRWCTQSKWFKNRLHKASQNNISSSTWYVVNWLIKQQTNQHITSLQSQLKGDMNSKERNQISSSKVWQV